MGSTIGALCLMFCLALATTSGAATNFDVKMFGARADGKTDDSNAINHAWREACNAAHPSTLTISKGRYLSGPLTFTGPCKAPVTVRLDGTVLAPTDASKLKSQDGWVYFFKIDRLTVAGNGVFDGQGHTAWTQNNCAKTGKCSSLPINIRFSSISNSVVRDITSKDSKLFHINIIDCKNLTFQHIKIDAPEDSLNTDGIHIGRSNGVYIIDSHIKTGDDCVSLGDGCQHILVERVICGPGHGISIGSLGRYHNEQPVNGITVRNCTLINTANGVRVKTWPGSPSGSASDMHFENIHMRNVSNPILIDQEYCPYGKCQAQLPSKVKISNVSFKQIKGTTATELAVKLACSKGFPCQGVKANDIDLKYNGVGGKAMSKCVNVRPSVTKGPFPAGCQ